MHFADAICTYYLRYNFYKKYYMYKIEKMLCSDYTGAILGFGTYHFFQYIRSVLNNVLKSLLYKIIKMSLLVIWAPPGALKSVFKRNEEGKISFSAHLLPGNS